MIEIFDKYDYGDFNEMKEKYYPYAMFIIEDWTTSNYDNGKFNIFVFIKLNFQILIILSILIVL